MIKSINWWLVGTIVFSFLFLYLLSPILTPFFIAALLAYLGDPLVNRLSSMKIPRTLAVIVVFLFFILIIFWLLFLLIPMLERQILILINKIPIILTWIQQVALPWISQRTGIQEVANLAGFKILLTKHWEQATNIATVILHTVTRSGFTLFVFLLNLVLVPVVTFYLLRDWDNVTAGIHRLIPRSIERDVLKLLRECNEVIGAFFRGQLLVMLSLGIFYAIGLSLVGLELGLLLGIVIGFISIVPYLGFTVGILIATIATFVQFHDWLHLVYVFIVFGIGHIVENYLLYPLLVGDRIGLHPVVVIFAILAGGQLFGFIGVLLALPLAAIIMVLVRYLIRQYLMSDWYSNVKTKA